VDDNDTLREPAQHVHRHPLEVLDSAMAQLLVERAQLSAAIENRDRQDAEISANDAVTCWLTAQQALRRLEAIACDDARRRIAAKAVHSSRRDLVQLLDHARARLAAAPSVDLVFEHCGSRSRSRATSDESAVEHRAAGDPRLERRARRDLRIQRDQAGGGTGDDTNT